MDNYIKTIINHMAHNTNTVLTDQHCSILDYAYRYYGENKVGPLYQNISNKLGFSRQDIEQLFPHGLNSIYTWVGIPIYSTNNRCQPISHIEIDDFREVYLDYNATTPMREEVSKYLTDYNNGIMGFGNPSSSTNPGKQAYDQIYAARSQIADCLQVDPEEIVFVSGGSEANNMAIKGIAFQNLKNKGHLITNKIEHSSVLQTMHFLQEIGFEVTFLDVDKYGFISPQQVQKNLKKETLLVSIMAANNEIGTISPISEIGKICQNTNIPFMVDAVQAFGRMKLNPKQLGISLLTISGHKIYGPKGVGALYVDSKVSLTPLIHGGEQEFAKRAGTENVGAIIAFGKAAQLIYGEMEQENERLVMLRDFFLKELKKVVPDFIINGPLEQRLPHNLSISFPNIDNSALLLSLNQIGIYASAGSACKSGKAVISHVLNAIGLDTNKYTTIRFSFGKQTTKSDVEYVLKYLPIILDKLT